MKIVLLLLFSITGGCQFTFGSRPSESRSAPPPPKAEAPAGGKFKTQKDYDKWYEKHGPIIPAGD